MQKLTSHHIALKSPNYEQAKTFYTETLGFPIVGQIPGSTAVFIDIGGTTIELSEGPPMPDQEPPESGLIHLAFEVDDVDEVYNELVQKGVEFFVEPTTAGEVRIAFFYDPDGNRLELFCCPALSWRK